MESPPKRMTRARAAAKASSSSVKTARIVTAAARAKSAPSSSTATASTRSNAAKRKVHPDDADTYDSGDDEHGQLQQAEMPARKPRGRPRKAPEEDDLASGHSSTAMASTKATRARVTRKPPVPTQSSDERAVRGRAKKADAEEDAVQETATRKTTRVRAGTVTSSTIGTTSSKPTAKKSVKFEEPDKENVEPATSTKGKESAGPASSIRGRSTRRVGGAPSSAVASSSRAAQGVGSNGVRKKPLSPKKVTQMPVSRDRDSSEDELAGTEFTPAQHATKNPAKSQGRVLGNVSRKTDAPAKAAPTDQADEQKAAAEACNSAEDGLANLGSPARRPPPSPFKDSMKSPAKKIGSIPFPGSTMKSAGKSAATQPGQTSPFKSSLLMSAAKRPPSPIKGLTSGSIIRSENMPQSALKSSLMQSPAKRSVPGLKSTTTPGPRKVSVSSHSPPMKPISMETPSRVASGRPSERLMMEDSQEEDGNDDADDELFNEPLETLKFPGRLSAVLPRHVDPVADDEVDGDQILEEKAQSDLLDVEVVAEEADGLSAEPNQEPVEPQACADEALVMDDDVSAESLTAEAPQVPGASTPPHSPVEALNPMYQLREKDLDPCQNMDSESEDELASPVKTMTYTPGASPYKGIRPSYHNVSPSKSSRRSTMGFSSLTEQFGAWTATRPDKADAEDPLLEPASTNQSIVIEQSAVLEQSEKSKTEDHFFDDEMSVRPNSSPIRPTALTGEILDAAGVGEPEFGDVMITDEDFALAEEANEMSLAEPHGTAEAEATQSLEDNLSEASQEYGDENEVPIDPALLGEIPQEPVTPVRPLSKNFNTTTKVPLKPADHSTPSTMKKRSFSAPRALAKRPKGIPRSATVISYSPTKERRRSSTIYEDDGSAPATPAGKSDVWSTIGTPARTPRKDVDPSLLRGAVVYVDAHTSEGADASGIFVELLTQMGARCLKTWSWNPSSPSGSDSSSNKIGITHVVYKDGGKRTLEKIREANGLVQCVGVSWVLDCERENEWLDEKPYCIDTSFVPRGGARRRKSMEPKQLANLNGTLVSSPSKGGLSRESIGGLNTPMNRRDSTLWMHTPSDQGEEGQQEDEDGIEWSKILLTPVPKTPAPEAVARYAANIPETPTGEVDYDLSPSKQVALTQTCPPKSSVYVNMGEGILSSEKDEQVLMRLMKARRKSLQFAPKTASPLSKTWD